jgi:hypothetical protein
MTLVGFDETVSPIHRSKIGMTAGNVADAVEFGARES